MLILRTNASSLCSLGIWHSQIVRHRHPSLLRLLLFLLSRIALALNSASQKSALDFGSTANLHPGCWCQNSRAQRQRLDVSREQYLVYRGDFLRASIPKSVSEKKLSDHQFRLGVLPTNARHHAAAGRLVYDVHNELIAPNLRLHVIYLRHGNLAAQQQQSSAV